MSTHWRGLAVLCGVSTPSPFELLQVQVSWGDPPPRKLHGALSHGLGPFPSEPEHWARAGDD